MLSIVPQAITPDNDETYQRAVRAVAQMVTGLVGPDAAFADQERAVLTVANEVCRGLLVESLQATADAQPARVRIDGVEYARHQPGTGVYHSLCGPLEVRRATYREVGLRHGPTVVPLELVAGLIEDTTPALAYRVGLGYAQGPSRQAAEQMQADHRQPPSRSTLERLGKALGTYVQKVGPRVEAVVRADEALPVGAHAIVVGLDRTSVPMEEPGTSETPRRTRTTPYVRARPAPVDVNYRMAYVGTVSVVDHAGEALLTRRYAIPSTADPVALTARMMADVTRARAQQPRLPVAVVQDAAPELWALTRTALTTTTRLRRWDEAIDRYHLNERLGAVLREIEPDERQRQAQGRRWNAQLDTDDRAIDRIARWIAERMTGPGVNTSAIEPHFTYLTNNQQRMRYATLRTKGLPVGSGVTEGACKSVVAKRAKGSGQRWHEDGIAAALTLRAVYLSERLPTMWPHIAAGYSAEVLAAA